MGYMEQIYQNDSEWIKKTHIKDNVWRTEVLFKGKFTREQAITKWNKSRVL